MLLRQTAEAGGAPGVAAGYANRSDDERDDQIGGFLFAAGPIAERDQIGKRLINTGVADAFDLHTLEAVLIALRATPRTVWRSPNGG